MKSRLIALCTALTLILLLPVYANAETQSEFELLCGKKTAAACTVYFNTSMETVLASIPAGTYVQVGDTVSGTSWKKITFFYNGSKITGWADVTTKNTTSVVRSGGVANSVHEKDPDYDSKMQQGTVERDVCAGWSIYDEDGETASVDVIGSENAAARAGQYAGSSGSDLRAATTGYATTGTTLGQTSTTDSSASSASTEVTMRSKLRRVSGSEAPEDLLTAFVYAPNTGKASLREADDKASKVLAQCTSGTVVVVLEIGKIHSLVEINGQTGYLRNDCLGYSAVKEDQVQIGSLIGGGNINVRAGADKDSARIAQWSSGTQVTVYGVDGNWCEVEYDGQHGWVASKYVVVNP